MSSEITRRIQRIAASTATSVGSATAIRFEDFAGGIVAPTSEVLTEQVVAFYASDYEDGTYYRLVDFAGSPANVIWAVGDPTYASLPDAAFAAPFIKMVSSTAHDCVMLLKS